MKAFAKGAIRLGSLAALAAAGAAPRAAAQDSARIPAGTTGTVIVRSLQPSRIGDSYQVKIGDSTRTLASGGFDTIRVPSGRQPVDISVRLAVVQQGRGGGSSGKEVSSWKETLTVKPLGTTVIDVVQDGASVIIGYWPQVTWVAEDGTKLDVYLNGISLGPTPYFKGIEPGRNHTMLWKKGSAETCRFQAKLLMNETRTFSCNAATGGVIEK